jgi:hypothetical protein
MALSLIDSIRVNIGDTITSPYYAMTGSTIFTDEEIQYFLDLNGNDIGAATKTAAIAASFQIAGIPTREKSGNIEVWNTFSTSYLKTLGYIITTPLNLIPNGLMPWVGGISKAEVCANNASPDLIQSPLNNIYTCDSDDICNPASLNNCGC